MSSSTHGQAFTLHAQELARRERTGESLRLWWATVPKCCALNRLGLPCSKPVKSAGDTCKWHGAGVARTPSPARAGAGVYKRVAQEHAKLMRAAWRRDRWTPGATIIFTAEGGGEGVFQRWLAAYGIDGWALPPSVADWARWRLRRLLMTDEDVFGPPGHRLHDQVVTRMAKAGPPPLMVELDLSEQSMRDAWHKGVLPKKGKPWVRPLLTMGERLHAAVVARERMGLPARGAGHLQRQVAAHQSWRPSVGPAHLTPAEQDLLGMAERQGARQVERARADIEAGRRLFW